MEEKRKREAEQRLRAEEELQAAALKKAQSTTLREVLEHYLANHRTAHGRLLRSATQADCRHHVEKNLKEWADQLL